MLSMGVYRYQSLGHHFTTHLFLGCNHVTISVGSYETITFFPTIVGLDIRHQLLKFNKFSQD